MLKRITSERAAPAAPKTVWRLSSDWASWAPMFPHVPGMHRPPFLIDRCLLSRAQEGALHPVDLVGFDIAHLVLPRPGVDDPSFHGLGLSLARKVRSAFYVGLRCAGGQACSPTFREEVFSETRGAPRNEKREQVPPYLSFAINREVD